MGRLIKGRFRNAAAGASIGSADFGTANLLTKTQDFSHAVWAIGGGTVTVTADQAVAPDGTTTADRVNATGGAIREQSLVVTATTYTFSVWLKAVSGTPTVPLMIYDTTHVAVLVTVNASPSTTVWTRYSLTGTFPAGSALGECGFNVATYDVYAWGAQLQKGSVAGPYRAVP